MRLRLTLSLILLPGIVLVGCSKPESPNQRPEIRLLQPQDLATFVLGGEVNVEAEASDPDGEISRVSFYVDNQEVAADATPPYRYRFVPNDARHHLIAARAYDDQNVSSESDSVTVNVTDEDKTLEIIVALDGDGDGGVMSNPSGIACPDRCRASFPLNLDVSLTANPASGSSFGGWGGACAGASRISCRLNAREVRVLEAAATFLASEPSGVIVSLSPHSVDLEPLQAADFTAVVTGSDNTAVRWVASGGSISGTGTTVTYTAPAEVGSYAITATSVADPSVSAEAEVAVSQAVSPNEPFAIIALPDTQNYVCSRCTSDARKWQPEMFMAQTQWVVENLDAFNIAFVTHLGDIVECANRNVELGCNVDGKDEWAAADAAMSLLDGKVPYAGTIGDHDYFPEETRYGDTSNYLRYFGASRYQGYSWYGGAGPNELSHYQIFSAGPYTFLNISLEFEARDETLAWAQQVIEEHPGIPTLITTHGYLQDTSGAEGRSTVLDVEPPVGNTGQEVFEKLVYPNHQVFIVLNGHYHDSEHDDTGANSDNGEYHQISENSADLPVYEMLSSYQDRDNGGDGWLRIIEFMPGMGEGGLDRIRVQTYSPTRGEFQPGAASNFHFDLDFDERFQVP